MESHGYFLGSTEIKPMEFVDDIADPSEGQLSAQMNNKIIWIIFNVKKIVVFRGKV